MKILLSTTFRSFDKPLEKTNQLNFLKSINVFSNEIDLCVTQFNEKNVKSYIFKNFHGKKYYQNTKPKNYKWSHSEVLKFGLKKMLKKKYDYLGWSASDLKFDKRCFEILRTSNEKAMYTFFPNISNRKKNIVEFGLDVFFFKLDKKQIKKLLKILNKYPNYNWGMFEHYLFSLSKLFELKIINLRTKCNITKKENVVRNSKNNLQSWKSNKVQLEKMLKDQKLSILYAKGSMYYLAFKMISLRNVNFQLFLIYIKLLLKFILRLINGKKY